MSKYGRRQIKELFVTSMKIHIYAFWYLAVRLYGYPLSILCFFLEHAGLRIISLIEEEKTKLRYNSHPHNKLKLGASYKRNTRPKATLTSR
jgi:hypothetical protein